MSQIKKKGADRFKLPPYDTDLECPLCRAVFALTPGDRYDVMVGWGVIVTECPSCRSEATISVPNAGEMQRSVVVIPYVEWERLHHIAENVGYINQMLSAAQDIREGLEWTEKQVDWVAQMIRDLADAKNQIAPPRQQHEVEDKPRRARPSRGRQEEDEIDFDPRGNVDPEVEEELHPVVHVGRRGGRGARAVPVTEALSESGDE